MIWSGQRFPVSFWTALSSLNILEFFIEFNGAFPPTLLEVNFLIRADKLSPTLVISGQQASIPSSPYITQVPAAPMSLHHPGPCSNQVPAPSRSLYHPGPFCQPGLYTNKFLVPSSPCTIRVPVPTRSLYNLSMYQPVPVPIRFLYHQSLKSHPIFTDVVFWYGNMYQHEPDIYVEAIAQKDNKKDETKEYSILVVCFSLFMVPNLSCVLEHISRLEG